MTNNKILGLLGLASRAGKITAGSDATKQDIKKNRIKLVIIAEDASERTKTKFIEFANQAKIPIIIMGNIEEISKSIGKNNKAIIGVKEDNIANEIEKLYRGDVNGEN